MNAPFAIETSQVIDMIASADLPARSFLRQSWFTAGPQPATIFADARSPSGAPLAAFPLRKKRVGPFAINEIAGAYWPMRAVPMDAGIRTDELAASLHTPQLRRSLGRAWRVGPVLDDDLQLAKLLKAARAAGWHVLSREVGSIFALDLAALTASGKWPSTKGQQKDRWRVRQLEKTGPVTIRHFTGEDWTAADRDAIAAIESNSWVGKLKQGGDTKFLDPGLRALWEDIARDPAIAAMIRGSTLHVGDTPAAFTFGLDCGDTRYCIANNFDQQFHKFSPGRVLLYDDFTSAATRGIKTIDWGLGDGGYKAQMGAEQTTNVSDLLIVRGSLLASLLRPLWQR